MEVYNRRATSSGICPQCHYPYAVGDLIAGHGKDTHCNYCRIGTGSSLEYDRRNGLVDSYGKPKETND
jgi:hypothetical protein